MSWLMILFLLISPYLYGDTSLRNDNYYVKGAYGYAYESQRYRHWDYIAQEYDSSDKELGEHIKDYIDYPEDEFEE